MAFAPSADDPTTHLSFALNFKLLEATDLNQISSEYRIDTLLSESGTHSAVEAIFIRGRIGCRNFKACDWLAA